MLTLEELEEVLESGKRFMEAGEPNMGAFYCGPEEEAKKHHIKDG